MQADEELCRPFVPKCISSEERARRTASTPRGLDHQNNVKRDKVGNGTLIPTCRAEHYLYCERYVVGKGPIIEQRACGEHEDLDRPLGKGYVPWLEAWHVVRPVKCDESREGLDGHKGHLREGQGSAYAY